MLDRSISELAETAIRAIQVRMVEHSGGSIVEKESSGRQSSRFRDEIANKEVIATIVGTVEEFMTSLLIEKCPHVSYSSVFSWPKRIAAWRQHGGVDLRVDCDSFGKFEGFVAARNAIMHKSGSLTDMQLDGNRKPATYGKLFNDLRMAGIEWFGRELIIEDRTVLDCAACCIEVVRELDARSSASTTNG
jgi:hypothetical protein